MSDNGVFISYRRGIGSEVARTITEFLEGQGFDVFLDVDSLGAGHFDEQLLREIESRRSFVLICSPGCLDRCVHEGDWVRRELEYAIRTGRHIVPVTMPQFVWPSTETMPPVVGELLRHNAFEYSHSHWKMIKPKLAEMLRAGRSNSSPQPPRAAPVLSVEPIVALRMEGERDDALRPAVVPHIQRAQSWCEVLAEAPDPGVVTDGAGRARMIATGLPWKVKDKRSGIVFLLCPPGEFLMGSPESETGRSAFETQHRRTIGGGYYLGETEVTQKQWQRLMGANPSFFKGEINPVDSVRWDDCKRFCTSAGLRLPSEAEWEYACRAGTTGAHAGPLDEMAWYRRNADDRTHPVAKLRANAWGLFDMHGNVWEWCEDGFGQFEAGDVTEAAARTTADGWMRVVRGGSCFSDAAQCRTADRHGHTAPGLVECQYGFRVARTPD
jgi:formylglycine-generating enzyme required for sulfatase activity